MEHAVAFGENHLVLGRYRPLRPLGSGGAGSVWLAQDVEGDREVALKIVAREGKAGERAEREVEAATRLRHPRCLRALALARDDGHVYVAYPFISGCTLRDALRGGALDDWSSIEAAAQILEALAHAHSKGVVHRDVKPANVMVENGEEISIRLLDFGMAQIDEADTLTAVGDVPGTLAYIAPE
ncbi:MAG TPA: serine/threonine-protein kinase, partial [Gaiellaceae bacterium]|nr:serine/threonine-protein kinase [Gaiellaceae bacterium]